MADMHTDTIYLAGGCFWGVEHLFHQIPGVVSTQVGYANGSLEEGVTYERVCRGDTGFRETVEVVFDPAVVSLNRLLWAFFSIVDPTLQNQQGHDVGTQYQSGIYWNAADKDLSAAIQTIVDAERARVEASRKRFCVEVRELTRFVPAEEYHQEYLVKNPGGYCHVSPARMQEVLSSFKTRVAIIEPLGVSEQLVRSFMDELDGCTYEYYTERSTDQQELARRAQGADILVVANAPVSKAVLEAAPKLRAISVAFTGIDHIDLEYCGEHGIDVINCAGYATEAVAEEVFGLALSLYRHLGECDRRVRAGADKSGLVFGELRGKKLGVIGNGDIAKRVFELGQAFGMQLLCYARTERPITGVTYVTLEELCVQSDVLSIHVPAVPDTFHMIGAPQFGMMKPTAILINTARGPIVDTDALVSALEEGRIAGAGLDVFDTEPPLDPASPILHAPHTVLAPHIGFATQEALDARAKMALDHVHELIDSI